MGGPLSAGLAEIAERGRDQLQEQQASAEPSAAGRGESNGAPQPAETSPAELVTGREQWLYFVNPEQPVAGQSATIYFNNNVSDILRYMRPHWKLHCPCTLKKVYLQHAVCSTRLGVACCWLAADMDKLAREKARQQVHVKFSNSRR